MSVLTVLAALALLVWLYLLLGRGFFWLASPRDDQDEAPDPARWPTVAAVVPARDEAAVIASSIGSLLRQDYPGQTRIVLVDDQSGDGTAHLARGAAGDDDRLTVMAGSALPQGWTGKLWALEQGIAAATAGQAPDYLLLTDADIAHEPDNLRRLVARAEAGQLVLVSLMAKLSCRGWAERLLIPAFVFFFQMLYPFRTVNDPRKSLAAAAGGCMLIRTAALIEAGGVAAIAHQIIDDCAMGRLMKGKGPVWLGLTERARSIRPYMTFGQIRRMVARTAFAQLRYSTPALIGTVLSLGLIYLTPPLLALFAAGPARFLGLAAWILMGLSFVPIARFYRQPVFSGVALPVIAAFYAAFTIDSAIAFRRGRGGLWKGRAQAIAPGP